MGISPLLIILDGGFQPRHPFIGDFFLVFNVNIRDTDVETVSFLKYEPSLPF